MSAAENTPMSMDGRDRRWDHHRQERRERLLTTAVDLIDRDGGAVGVARIAKTAGIPRSVIYKLFRNRQDLDEHIRRRIVDEMTTTLEPALVPGGTVRQMVTRSIRTYVGWVDAHPHLHRFMGEGSASAPERGSRVMVTGKATFADTVRVLIEGMLPEMLGSKRPPKGIALNLANSIVGCVDFTVNGWLAADSGRGSSKNLVQFLSAATCAQIEAAAQIAGGEIDLDVAVRSRVDTVSM